MLVFFDEVVAGDDVVGEELVVVVLFEVEELDDSFEDELVVFLLFMLLTCDVRALILELVVPLVTSAMCNYRF